MSITILNPRGSGSAVSVGQPVLFQAAVVAPESAANLQWSSKVNSGSFTQFSSGSAQAILTTPTTVVNKDGSSNLGVDVITVQAKDSSTMVTTTTTLVLVQGVPAINLTGGAVNPTSGVSDPDPTPVCTPNPGGVVDPSEPVSVPLMDEDNRTPDRAVPASIECVHALSERRGKKCGCSSPLGSGIPPAYPGGGEAGLVQPDPVFVPNQMVAMSSQVSQWLYGALQVKTGCLSLPTRGETLDLGSYFGSVPDGLVAAERFSGLKRMFGWQCRLIKDTAGNAALYWGDRRVEGWTPGSGGAFVAAKGTFGTLTQQGNGSFTRTTKDAVYFDFDANGRLQTVKDRSQNGNVIYFNYNASNQMTRITGPGLGFSRVYFKYDANARVSLMNLESPIVAQQRTTYYGYDGSGHLNKVIGPTLCITYFDYDANNNLNLVQFRPLCAPQSSHIGSHIGSQSDHRNESS